MIEVAEHPSGRWYYHLRDTDKSPTRSLCGIVIMQTKVPLSAWGFKGELKEKWCDECARLREAAIAAAPAGSGKQAPARGSPRRARRGAMQ